MNIVFDFGGVIFTWNSKELVTKYFKGQELCERVHQAVFAHPDWAEVDRGTMTLAQVTENSAKRTGLPVEEIARLTYGAAEALVPIPESIELVKRLKQRHIPVYALSNMGVDHMQYLRNSYDFFGLFDRLIISSEVKMIKPEPQIYRYLLDSCQLDPRETVFFDDYPANIEAASRFGIQAIRFTSSAQCEAELIRLGCL